MSKGTPYSLRCRKCKGGMWNGRHNERTPSDVRPLGITENRVTTSNHKGYGDGGASFTGYRGKVRCFVCGHEWFSTHARSGRMYQCACTRSCYGGNGKPKPGCARCHGTGKVDTFKESWGGDA